MASTYSTQNQLLLSKLLEFYDDTDYLDKMLDIINGKSRISLRIIDWFSTNYAKKYFTVYDIERNNETIRFKVYADYKRRLDGYSKRRFDPFCRWERIMIPYKENTSVQTTIGQLNFFKWAIENKIIDYIENNFKHIEADMNQRNSTAKRRVSTKGDIDKKSKSKSKGIKGVNGNKTRKKREELSVSAAKTIKKEEIEIIIKFD